MKQTKLRLKKENNQLDWVKYKKIIRIESLGNYVKVFCTKSRCFTVHSTLIAFCKPLEKRGICQVSKCCYVNTKRIITELSADNQLLMSDMVLVNTTNIWEKSKTKYGIIITYVKPDEGNPEK